MSLIPVSQNNNVNNDLALNALRQNLRAANVASLPQILQQAYRKAGSQRITPHLKLSLLIEIAKCLRALGKLEKAGELLEKCLLTLPARSGDLLSAIKREQSYILLDTGKLKEAHDLAYEVDSDEFEIEQTSRIFRNESQITSRTWGLLAEIALAQGTFDSAKQYIERAVEKHTREEEERTVLLNKRGYAARILATPDSRRKAQNASDFRQYLRFLEAVRFCATDNLTGFEILAKLEHDLSNDPDSNKQLLGCVMAANSTWQYTDESSQPPLGINIYEARRWQSLTSGKVKPNIEAAIPEKKNEEATSHTQAIEAFSNLGAVESNSPLAALQTLVLGVLEHLDRIYAKPAVGRFDDKVAFGGTFDGFDIFSMIGNAENKKHTGFISFEWNTESVETSILTHRLHESARKGTGWIFMVEGVIIDATIGSFDPPVDRLDDEEDANQSLMIILQIALSIGLDYPSSGTAKAILAASILGRPSRIRVTSMNLWTMATEREKELGISQEIVQEGDGNLVGEWG